MPSDSEYTAQSPVNASGAKETVPAMPEEISKSSEVADESTPKKKHTLRKVKHGKVV